MTLSACVSLCVSVYFFCVSATTLETVSSLASRQIDNEDSDREQKADNTQAKRKKRKERKEEGDAVTMVGKDTRALAELPLANAGRLCRAGIALSLSLDLLIS